MRATLKVNHFQVLKGQESPDEGNVLSWGSWAAEPKSCRVESLLLLGASPPDEQMWVLQPKWARTVSVTAALMVHTADFLSAAVLTKTWPAVQEKPTAILLFQSPAARGKHPHDISSKAWSQRRKKSWQPAPAAFELGMGEVLSPGRVLLLGPECQIHVHLRKQGWEPRLSLTHILCLNPGPNCTCFVRGQPKKFGHTQAPQCSHGSGFTPFFVPVFHKSRKKVISQHPKANTKIMTDSKQAP